MTTLQRVLDFKTSGVGEIIVSGKKILVISYVGCILAKFTDSYITAPFIRHMEERGLSVWHLVKKYAFVGMNNAKKYILQGFNDTRNFDEFSFDTDKEAIDFLLKEDW